MTGFSGNALSGKADIRARIMAVRRMLGADELKLCARQLAERGLGLCRQYKPKSVALYKAMRNEADPAPLLQSLAKAGFATLLPRVISREEMAFHLWRPGDPLRRGRLDIEEPLPTAPVSEADLLFIPLAAFDRQGYRIGYGGGLYDRVLQGMRRQRPIVAVGMAYSFQEEDEIPRESHDEAVDFVITERETIDCRQNARKE